jgi:NTE family protein
LERDLGRVYGDGYFESVDYSVLATRERNILRITPMEKSWGPNYLRFGMDLEASSQENEFAIRGAYHKRPINRLGGDWLSGFQVGERDTIFTEFYQPFDARQHLFIEPAIGISKNLYSAYQDDHRIAQYRIRERMAVLNLGANVGVIGQVRVGRTIRKLDSAIETGSISLPTGERHVKGWSSAIDFDRFDRAFFPTKGWAARANYFQSDDEGYSRLTAVLRAARSWGPYAFNGRFYYVGSPQGRAPVYDAGFLGGFLNLSGYARNQILAGDIRFASIRAEKVIGKMPLGLAGDLRAGVSLETGNARERFTETNLNGWQKAGAIYFGGETPFGPLFLGYGYADGGHSSFYLFLGLP